MKIKASVGQAPRSVSLRTCVHNIHLTAQTQGEKKWLAGLLQGLYNVPERATFLGSRVSKVTIVTDKHGDTDEDREGEEA